MRVLVFELTTVEVLALAGAAVRAHGPEVVAVELSEGGAGVAYRDGRHAVGLLVPEAHGLRDVQHGRLREDDLAGVHQHLPPQDGGVHILVGVQVVDVVEWPHVGVVVHVADHHAGHPCDGVHDEEEDVPRRLPARVPGGLLLQLACRGDAAGHDGQEAEAVDEVDEARLRVVPVEGRDPESHAEEHPRRDDGDGNGHGVDAPPLPGHKDTRGAFAGVGRRRDQARSTVGLGHLGVVWHLAGVVGLGVHGPANAGKAVGRGFFDTGQRGANEA
mmetsp:Transcript_138502/g.430701  ORF Transcript_138502/g.430701 Transcript_138502/m.430701 type:complete len:273 (-) Transcript_138502:3-821(-)